MRKAAEVPSDARERLEELVAKYQRETQRAVERVVQGVTAAAKGASGSMWLHHGSDGSDDLRKDAALAAEGWTPAEIGVDRANREAIARREGAEIGRRVGDVLVKGAELAKARRAAGEQTVLPTNAIAEAAAEVARLKALYKANGWVPDARLLEAERLCEALSAPVSRAPVSAPEPTPAAVWTPHAGDEAAGAAAAALAGGSPEEVAAAIRSNDASWLNKIAERGVVAAIKAVRGVRCGAAPPPRFGVGA